MIKLNDIIDIIYGILQLVIALCIGASISVFTGLGCELLESGEIEGMVYIAIGVCIPIILYKVGRKMKETKTKARVSYH